MDNEDNIINLPECLPRRHNGLFGRPLYAKLDENNNVITTLATMPDPEAIATAMWMEQNQERRQVGKTYIGNLYVSTVFIGVNLHMWGDGPDLWFETMIFGGPWDEYQVRFATWVEAKAGHAKAVRFAKVFRWRLMWWGYVAYQWAEYKLYRIRRRLHIT